MTNRRTLKASASRLVIAGILASLALAGCKPAGQQAASSAPPPLAALPLATSDAPPIAPAPSASALPPAPRATIGRLADTRDRYAYADRAYAMNSGFGDAPPDYTFDYGDGERPWVWRGDDNSMRVAEPLSDGGDRYYYYEPGADAPYLVRDPEYSYGYANGALVVIYDSRGRALPPNYLDRRADVAGRFLVRARAIRQASERQRREAVAQARWAERRRAMEADREQWTASQAADQDWRAYHSAHEQQDDAHWAGERYRRESEGARFAQSVNDQQQADRDLQAAQRAQARAVAASQAPATRVPDRGGLFGFGPKPQQQPFAPVQPMQADTAAVRQAQLEAQTRARASVDAARQAQAAEQAKLAADRQAQIQSQVQARAAADAGRRGQIEAARQAQGAHPAEVVTTQTQAKTAADAGRRGQFEAARQALAAHQAEAVAAHQAQIQSQTQAKTAADASRNAQLEAARQVQAAHQAAAVAAHQAQIQSQTQAKIAADAGRRAQVEAARQTQAARQAQHQSQAAQAQSAHAAQQAGHDAAVAAAARREAPKPPAVKPPPAADDKHPHPHRVGPDAEHQPVQP
jgi:hypothetical protein